MTSPSSGSSPYNSSCSDSESPGDDPAKEVQFWRRYNRIAFIITTICWVAIIVMLTTGCRKPWPWQKPPTYGCRVLVPSGSVKAMHEFIVWNHGVLYPWYMGDGWWRWYGDPWGTGTNYPIVAFSRGGSNPEIPPWNLPPAAETLWNRPDCP